MAKDKDRVILSQAVGKICAYLAVGKKGEAKEWAKILILKLAQLGLT